MELLAAKIAASLLFELELSAASSVHTAWLSWKFLVTKLQQRAKSNMANSSIHEAFIYDGGRTAFGRHSGALSPVRPDDLLAHTIKSVVERNEFPKEAFEDVIAGNTNQAGEDCRNVARFASLLAGMPAQVGGLTVNRLCASGLAATLSAASSIKIGEGDLFVTGGVESMSRAPLVLSKAHTAFDRGQQIADTTLGARFTNPLYAKAFGNDTMPQTADNIAADLGISVSYLYQLLKKERRPSLELAIKIERHTNGSVSAEELRKEDQKFKSFVDQRVCDKVIESKLEAIESFVKNLDKRVKLLERIINPG